MKVINTLTQSLVALLFLTFYTVSLHAQVELQATSLVAEQNDQVQIDITTTNFDSLIGLQFTLEWDTTVIDLVDIQNLGLPQLTPDNINVDRAGQGLIALAWLDNSLAGVSLEDDAVLFTITYQVVGMPGDSSMISFTDSIAVVEAIDAATNEVPVNVSAGKVSLDEINSITNIPQNVLSLSQNFPNPFRESTIISANFAAATSATLHIFNSNGQQVYTHKQRYSAGDHFITIDHKIFPEVGIYWYQLKTSEYSVTKSLIFIP